MLNTLAIANYRSLRELIVPLDRLNVISGPNGCGKSNLYRGLRLMAETAMGTAVESIAHEGGLHSVLWAGPEEFARGVKEDALPVQGVVRNESINLRFGFSGDNYSYAIDFGYPSPVPGSMFNLDPVIKREVIWHGEVWHDQRAMVDRRGPLIRARDDGGKWQAIEKHLPTFDSMLSRVVDPERVPEILMLREEIRSWRFYDHFRTDVDSVARQPQIGTRTPILSNDGHDLATAWQTILEVGDGDALDVAVDDAFPGATVSIETGNGRFELQFQQHGLLRPLSQSELSDGTLRYLLWIAALLTPRPPALMVLNEPETSLHPDLLPALSRLMAKFSEETQLWVISHDQVLIEGLKQQEGCNHIGLDKEMGETFAHDQDLFERPPWRWPTR